MATPSITVSEISPDTDPSVFDVLKTFCIGTGESGVDEDTVRRDFWRLKSEWKDYERAKAEGKATEQKLLSVKILFVAKDQNDEFAGFCIAQYPEWLIQDPNMDPFNWILKKNLSGADQWAYPQLLPELKRLIEERMKAGKTLKSYVSGISAEKQAEEIDETVEILSKLITLFPKSEDDTKEDYAHYVNERQKKLIKYAMIVCTFVFDPAGKNDQLGEIPGLSSLQYLTNSLSSFDIFIDLLCVSPTKRGQYVGDYLLQAISRKVASLAPRFGFGIATLTLSPATIDLLVYYGNIGFKTIGTVKIPGRDDTASFMRTGNLITNPLVRKKKTKVGNVL